MSEHSKQPSATKRGPSAELRKVLEFLYGVGPLDGSWYGELPPEGKPRYWWRAKLRSAIADSFGAGATQ